MLNLLAKYSVDQGLVAKPGYAPKTVKWALQFAGDGRFLGIVELGDTSQAKNPGMEFAKCPDLPPNVVAGGGEGRSHFLAETAQVVCLVFKDEAECEEKTEKVQGKRRFFIRLLREASHDMPLLLPVAESLDDEAVVLQIQAACTTAKVKPTEKVTLHIGGSYPVESDAWHRWWDEFRISLQPERSGADLMRCFMTGEMREALSTQPKIRGLSDVGGIAMGDALICFDKDAFKSYGLEQAANCAVCEESAAAYKSALDHLISKHSRRLAGAKVAHWFSHSMAVEDDPLAWLVDGLSDEQEERGAQGAAKRLLESIRTGVKADLGNYQYYALTLSGAAGRVMVRDWMEGSFEQLAGNISAWFDDLSIVRRDGSGIAPCPKFMAVLGGTVRDLADVPPPIASRMWRTAVTRTPIPRQAMVQALARAKVGIIQDEPANHARMGLIKAFHIRNAGGGESMTAYLNEEHPHPAYQCGRLMAVLADLQRAALGDVGAGIVQRYYSAASSTPALVLGRLTRTSQFHLSKLDAGLAYWFNGRIADIWARIENSLPATLTLEEQSLFALGYYQQIAANRNKTGNTSTNEPKEDTDV